MSYISKRDFRLFLSYKKACKAGVKRTESLLRTRSVKQLLTYYQDLWYECIEDGDPVWLWHIPMINVTEIEAARLKDFQWLHSVLMCDWLLKESAPGMTYGQTRKARIDELISRMKEYL